MKKTAFRKAVFKNPENWKKVGLVAIATFAIHLPRTADVFGFFTLTLFAGLLKVPAQLHFAENPFALHLFLQNPQGLIDVIIADGYRYQLKSPLSGFLYRGFAFGAATGKKYALRKAQRAGMQGKNALID